MDSAVMEEAEVLGGEGGRGGGSNEGLGSDGGDDGRPAPRSLLKARAALSDGALEGAFGGAREALGAAGGAEALAARAAAAADMLLDAAEARGALSRTIAGAGRRLLDALSGLVAEVYGRFTASGISIEATAISWKNAALESKLATSAATAAEALSARAADAYGARAEAAAGDFKALVKQRGVFAAADLTAAASKSLESDEYAISADEARSRLTDAATELATVEGVSETLAGLKEAASSVGIDVEGGFKAVKSLVATVNEDVDGEGEKDTEEMDGPPLRKKSSSIVNSIDGVVSSAASALSSMSRDDLRGRAESWLQRPLTPAEEGVVDSALALWDELAKAPLAARFGKAFVAAARKMRQYAKEVEEAAANKTGGPELSLRSAASGAGDAWARLADERAELCECVRLLKPSALAFVDAINDVACNELLPGLTLPRFDGISDSPIGRICYHVGSLEFSKVSFDPKMVRLTLPSFGGGGPGSESACGGDIRKAVPHTPSTASAVMTAEEDSVAKMEGARGTATTAATSGDGAAPARQVTGGEAPTADRQSFGELFVPGIGVCLEGIRWQYSKRGNPYVPRDDGRARVDVSGLSCRIAYGFKLQGTTLTLLIRSVTVETERCDVRIGTEGGSNAVMYNLLMTLISKRMRDEISNQITLQLGGLVESISNLIRPYAAGVIEVAHTLEQPPPEPVFVSPYQTKQLVAGKVHVLDDVETGHFLKSLPDQPRLVYFAQAADGGDADTTRGVAPEWLCKLSERLGDGMLIAYVPFANKRVRRELGAAYYDTRSLPEAVLMPHSAPGGEPMWARGAADAAPEAIEQLCAPFSWAPNRVVAMDNTTNADVLLARPMRHVLVIMFTSQDPPPKAFRELARRHAEHAAESEGAELAPALFASVHVPTQPELVARFGVDRSPRVAFVPAVTSRAPSGRSTKYEFMEMPVTPRNVEVSLSDYAVPYRHGVVIVTEKNAEAFFLTKVNRFKLLVWGDRAEATPAVRELQLRYPKKLVVGYCGTVGGDDLRERFGLPRAGPAAIAALGHRLIDIKAEKEAMLAAGVDKRLGRAASSVGGFFRKASSSVRSMTQIGGSGGGESAGATSGTAASGVGASAGAESSGASRGGFGGLLRKASRSVSGGVGGILRSASSDTSGGARGGGEGTDSTSRGSSSLTTLLPLQQPAKALSASPMAGQGRGESPSKNLAEDMESVRLSGSESDAPIPKDEDDEEDEADAELTVLGGSTAAADAATWLAGGVPFEVEHCPPHEAASAKGLIAFAKIYARMKLSKRRLSRLNTGT